MSSDPFCEDLSFQLLNLHLNGDALNANILRDLFREKPGVLTQLDFGEGVTLDNLDQAMYGSNTHQVVELREAQKHELFHCVPCNKSFKRRDNLNRHMRSGLHARKVAAYTNAQPPKQEQEKDEQPEEETPTQLCV